MVRKLLWFTVSCGRQCVRIHRSTHFTYDNSVISRDMKFICQSGTIPQLKFAGNTLRGVAAHCSLRFSRGPSCRLLPCRQCLHAVRRGGVYVPMTTGVQARVFVPISCTHGLVSCPSCEAASQVCGKHTFRVSTKTATSALLRIKMHRHSVLFHFSCS